MDISLTGKQGDKGNIIPWHRYWLQKHRDRENQPSLLQLLKYWGKFPPTWPNEGHIVIKTFLDKDSFNHKTVIKSEIKKCQDWKFYEKKMKFAKNCQNQQFADQPTQAAEKWQEKF